MAENSSKVADDSPKITSFEELKAYAEKNFPESFAKLPPASCYRVDDKVDHYREGPRLYVGEVIDGDEVHVLEPAFGYVDLYDILCLESPDDDELEERSIRFYEPFCWVFPVKGAETDSNTETYTYDLVLKSYIAYCQAMLGYLSSPHTFPENFISHFRTACDAVARGIENKRMMLGIGEQTGASMGKSSMCNITAPLFIFVDSSIEPILSSSICNLLNLY
jgi:hypothetical protein